VVVADLDEAARRAVSLGATVIAGAAGYARGLPSRAARKRR
jgi:hypothetical protein